MIEVSEPAAKAGVEETRERMLAATRQLYATRGSRGTTTREVAMLAGVNEATLFRHFRTKQQLIDAMLVHYSSASSFTDVICSVRSLPTIEEQLRALALASVDAMRLKADLIKISMAEEITNPEGHSCAWRAPTQARRKLTEFFAEKVAAHELRGEPEGLARVFMSLNFALTMARGIWEDEALTPERAVTNIVDIFLNGARA